MNIKVLCPCGAKFRFEIEPVNGRLPGPVACPTCGGDATELANIVIAQQLAGMQPVAPMVMASTAEAPQSIMPPAGEMCPKHRTEMSAAECFVCRKPICLKCMEQFGYLCSSYC